MKTKFYHFLMAAMCLLTFNLSAQIDGLPANAEPGSCYVKCVTPDEFREVTETVVVKPSYTTLSIKPAVYKDVTETVVVKEATKRYDYVPAVYETIEVPYTSKEGRVDLNVVPASFNPDAVTLEIYPKVSRFEYMPFPDCASGNPADCQALCWQEYPAKFKTVPINKLASDASTTNVPVGEIGATYRKQVIKEPAKYVEVAIPAVTRTITKQVLVTPEEVVETVIPEVTSTVTKTLLVKAGGVSVWEKVECSLIQPNIIPVFYDLNSANLRPESKTVIDTTVYKIMSEQNNISVEIGAHTDSRGSKDYNYRLSQRRAQSVVDYLVSKGISRGRLVAKGYGEAQLKNKCADGVSCTEDQHQQNRRTTFSVINK